jgi:hypothetical protein
MDHHTTQREAAIAAVTAVEIAASMARAVAVFDALDQHAEHLTSNDRYDVALTNWRSFADVDANVPDRDVAALAVRAYPHLPEETLVDLIDIAFGEHDRDVETPGGGRLVWLPKAETVILSAPVAGGFIDAVLARGRRA